MIDACPTSASGHRTGSDSSARCGGTPGWTRGGVLPGRQLAGIVLAGALFMAGCTGDRETEATDARAPTPAPAGLTRDAVTRADRDAWRSVVDWPDECEQAFVATHEADTGGLTFHELDGDVTLIEVRCAAGAYQGSVVFVRLDERGAHNARTLQFPVYEAVNGEPLVRRETVELWGEAAVLTEAGELTLLSVSRQTRDCGTWARYSVAQETPQLLELYAQPTCPAEPGEAAQPEPGRPPAGWSRISTN